MKNNKTKNIFLHLLISVFLLFQFNTKVIASDCKGPGVAITFDDTYVDSWYGARDLFSRYRAKATYFVSRPYNINVAGFRKLRRLQYWGHEIASHTLDHKGIASHYNSDPSLVDEYEDEQIIPSIKRLERQALRISTFAHPFGQYTDEYNALLRKNFLFFRATAYSSTNRPVENVDKVFFTRDNTTGLIFGVGIDNIYNNPLDEIEDGLIRAKDNNEVLVLYGHKITNEGGNYHTPPSKLEGILRIASELGLEFYTVSELRALCR